MVERGAAAARMPAVRAHRLPLDGCSCKRALLLADSDVRERQRRSLRQRGARERAPQLGPEWCCGGARAWRGVEQVGRAGAADRGAGNARARRGTAASVETPRRQNREEAEMVVAGRQTESGQQHNCGREGRPRRPGHAAASASAQHAGGASGAATCSGVGAAPAAASAPPARPRPPRARLSRRGCSAPRGMAPARRHRLQHQPPRAERRAPRCAPRAAAIAARAPPA